jgi:hypothetical protein
MISTGECSFLLTPEISHIGWQRGLLTTHSYTHIVNCCSVGRMISNLACGYAADVVPEKAVVLAITAVAIAGHVLYVVVCGTPPPVCPHGLYRTVPSAPLANTVLCVCVRGIARLPARAGIQHCIPGGVGCVPGSGGAWHWGALGRPCAHGEDHDRWPTDQIHGHQRRRAVLRYGPAVSRQEPCRAGRAMRRIISSHPRGPALCRGCGGAADRAGDRAACGGRARGPRVHHGCPERRQPRRAGPGPRRSPPGPGPPGPRPACSCVPCRAVPCLPPAPQLLRDWHETKAGCSFLEHIASGAPASPMDSDSEASDKELLGKYARGQPCVVVWARGGAGL